jgi:hypothetical protein
MLPPPHLSRRTFLAGSAGLLVLAACGDGGSDEGSTPRLDLEPAGEGGRVLIAGFAFQGGYLVTGAPQRLTFQIAGADGAPTTEVPDSLRFQLSRDGVPVGEPIEVSAHRDGVPLPYFPLRTTFVEPGTYQATVELDGSEQEQAFLVSEPAEVPLVQAGQAMVPVDTPTVDDHRGVEPYCTLEPPCPLHTETLRDALTGGGPVALLVATPAFCATALCGPVLELLVEQVDDFPHIRFVHAEVYADAEAQGGNLAAASLTPAVEAYGLTFEPSLFVADAQGTVVARLDNVYDRVDLREALDQAG